MKLDITPLLSGKVKALPFSYEIPSDGEDFPLPPVGVTFTSPVRVSGRITDSGTCLHLTLCAEADYDAYCDRCAEPTGGTIRTGLDRIVAEEGVINDENSDDYFIACDGALDLDEDIAEELVLAFPSQILCRDDCRGVCPDCGANLNHGDCGCAEKRKNEIDPRWQALAALLDRDNDENKK